MHICQHQPHLTWRRRIVMAKSNYSFEKRRKELAKKKKKEEKRKKKLGLSPKEAQPE